MISTMRLVEAQKELSKFGEQFDIDRLDAFFQSQDLLERLVQERRDLPKDSAIEQILKEDDYFMPASEKKIRGLLENAVYTMKNIETIEEVLSRVKPKIEDIRQKLTARYDFL